MVLKHSERERLKVRNEYVWLKITVSGPFLKYGSKSSGYTQAGNNYILTTTSLLAPDKLLGSLIARNKGTFITTAERRLSVLDGFIHSSPLQFSNYF